MFATLWFTKNRLTPRLFLKIDILFYTVIDPFLHVE